MRKIFKLFLDGRGHAKSMTPFLLIIAIIVAGFFYFNRSKVASQLVFERGKRYSYDFNFKNNNARALMSPGRQDKVAGLMSAMIELNGRFDIRCYKADETRYLLGGSFASLTTSEISFNSKPVFEERAKGATLLESKEFLFEMHPDGSIGKLFFDKEHHPLFRNIAKLVLAELRFRVLYEKDLAGDSEKDNYGLIDVVYRKDADVDNLFTKQRIKYIVFSGFGQQEKTPIFTQKVNSLFSFGLDGNGILQKVDGDEAISFKNDTGLKIFSNKTECSFALAKIDEFSIDERKIGRRLTSFINEKMGESAISDKSEKSMLQQQARGMSRQEMLTTFKVYGRTGKIHDKSLFLWRAVGFLKLHPEMIKDLFPLFEDSSITSEGRMLIFGLLASVESSEAQAAMLKLLGSETALNDSYYPLMYQHLTLLKKPDDAVVKKIEETYNNEKGEGDFKEEAALSLGAVAYNLRNNNQAEAADRLNNQLVSDLKSATTNKDKETMLDALGNSGDNDNFDEVSSYADASNSPQVRASALNALRRTDSKEATSLLIDMVEDDEPLVKKQAMNSLAHHELDDDSLAELEKKIINGSFSGSEYLDLLNLLSRFQKSNPQAVKNILEAFLAKGINDPHVVMRAKSLLDSVNKRLQGEI